METGIQLPRGAFRLCAAAAGALLLLCLVAPVPTAEVLKLGVYPFAPGLSQVRVYLLLAYAAVCFLLIGSLPGRMREFARRAAVPLFLTATILGFIAGLAAYASLASEFRLSPSDIGYVYDQGTFTHLELLHNHALKPVISDLSGPFSAALRETYDGGRPLAPFTSEPLVASISALLVVAIITGPLAVSALVSGVSPGRRGSAALLLIIVSFGMLDGMIDGGIASFPVLASLVAFIVIAATRRPDRFDRNLLVSLAAVVVGYLIFVALAWFPLRAPFADLSRIALPALGTAGLAFIVWLLPAAGHFRFRFAIGIALVAVIMSANPEMWNQVRRVTALAREGDLVRLATTNQSLPFPKIYSGKQWFVYEIRALRTEPLFRFAERYGVSLAVDGAIDNSPSCRSRLSRYSGAVTPTAPRLSPTVVSSSDMIREFSLAPCSDGSCDQQVSVVFRGCVPDPQAIALDRIASEGFPGFVFQNRLHR